MIWNREAETASRATMRALQTERLRATVARARARVPFYRDALAAASVKDEAVTLDRLADLPFTVKDDLRRHYPFGLFAVPRTEVSRIHASSGTRGKPTVVGYTRHDLGVWREVMARALAAAGAEPGPEAMRAQLEALWGCPALDFYGLSEIIGPGVAGECVEARDGLHVNEDHFLPEIVDPGSGAPLPAGDEGELVLTSLTKEALPMIRYRTGDVTRLEPAPCHCGRTTVRMARVKGRTDDMLIIKGVNVYPSQLEAALLTVGDLAPHYQLVVDRREAFPTLAGHVEPDERVVRDLGRFEAAPARLAALSAQVAECLRGHLGLNPEIAVVAPKTIPRSEGKAVRAVERG